MYNAREYKKRYREKNRERIDEYQRKYRAENREKIRESVKKSRLKRRKETKEIIESFWVLRNRIDKANELLSNIVVVKNDDIYRPVKNTTSQEVYKTICMLNELLKTPNRANYNLLQGSDKE